MTQPQQVSASPDPADAGQPPAWFVVVVLLVGFVFVGGATLAGILVVTSQDEAAPAPTSTTKQPTRAAPPAAPTSQPAASQDCDGPCGSTGTVCENGKCRLRPGFAWQARPSELTRARGWLSSNAPSQVCIARAGSGQWVCSPEKPSTSASNGKDVYMFPLTGRPALPLTREDLERTGVDIQLRGGGHVFAQQKAATHPALIAGPMLLKGGVKYRIDDDDYVVIKLDAE